MREIKFRAWDGERGLFLSVEPLRNLVFEYGNTYDYTTGEHVVFMQYTGLRDKNGTEIYEGDIIKVSWWGDYSLEVKWHVDCWYAENKDGTMGECGEEWEGDCEVIGNIYENPELLEENK